jgi:hypothetical protein
VSLKTKNNIFESSTDAGLYNWLDYDGIAGTLAHGSIGAVATVHTFLGRGRFVHPKVLTPTLNPSLKDRLEVK